MQYFCPDTFCPTHFKVNTFCPDIFCPTITFFMATTWSITWRCISIGKSVISIFNFSALNEWVAHIFKILEASEFLSNMLFNYHLLYFCTALSLKIMLSSHYHLHNRKTLSQLTQCPFTGTLLLFIFSLSSIYALRTYQGCH